MDKLRKILASQYLLWLVLAIPAISLIIQFAQGNARFGMLLHVSGEYSARFLVISLMATPLRMLFPRWMITKWLLVNRRFFGVSAFSYALLHTIFYLLKESMEEVMDEFFYVGILTGWLAFFIFIPLAITSTNAAIKKMGKSWKQLQRWVYLAAILTVLHWAWVDAEHSHWLPAMVNFSPVILLSLYRIWAYFLKTKNAIQPSEN